MLDEKQKEIAIENSLNHELFELRKKDHIRLSLSDESQVKKNSDLHKIQLIHEALPEFNLSEVDTSIYIPEIGQLKRPFFISSMTAGHSDSFMINLRLAQAAQKWGLIMGVGSQRKEISSEKARVEWQKIRESCPEAMLVGNIGITQLISTPFETIIEMMENLNAKALFVHSNPLQEALQLEGTPNFKNSLQTLDNAIKKSKIPIIFKEVGSGVSLPTAQKLKSIGLKYIDVSGSGGTHWGLIEGLRQEGDSIGYKVAKNFTNWGLSNLQSLQKVREVFCDTTDVVFASGGFRNGVDVAKALALGADAVGMAQPFLKAAVESSDSLDEFIIQTTQELRVSMFCTGTKTVADFKRKQVWQWLN